MNSAARSFAFPDISEQAENAGAIRTASLKRLKDWDGVIKSATTEIKIYEHTVDRAAGRNYSCLGGYDRMGGYQNAAEAYIRLGQFSDAEAVIARASQSMPDMSIDELARAARLEQSVAIILSR